MGHSSGVFLRSMVRAVGRSVALGAGAGVASALAVAASPVEASVGSRVLAKSDGSPDGLYYVLDEPLSPESAYVTEYLAGDFDPGDLIVGARVADYGPGTVPLGSVSAELRFEDPLNPGFPDLSPDGLVAEAAAGLESPCSEDPNFRREIGFLAVEAPTDRSLYLIVRLPASGHPSARCGIQLDTSSPPRGASKCYLGSTGEFLELRANHLAELRVLRSGPQDLGFDAHGTPRYAGDAGRPVVFARRSNTENRLTDDFVSLDIVVDNGEPQPVSLLLDVWADVSDVAPGHLPIELTSRFKTLGGSGRLDALRTFGRGRTVIKSVLRRSLPQWALGRLPARVRLDAALLDPMVPSVPRDRESAYIGLRPAPGIHDDGTSEQVLLVSEPSVPGDSLAVRFPLADLPRVPFTVSAVDVVGCSVGGANRLGYDAIEIRREDPIVTGSPDLSAEGLVRTVGAVDGVGEARMTPLLAVRRFAVTPFSVDPEAADTVNLWAQVVLAAGDRFDRGTVVGADLDAETLLFDSHFSDGGSLPYRRDNGRNYAIRLIVDEWTVPLESSGVDPFVPLGGLPGGYVVGGGPRPVSVVVVAGGHGGRD